MNPHSAAPSHYQAVPLAAPAAILGESPLWSPGEGLYWLDVPDQRLLQRTPTGQVTTVSLSEQVSAVELGPGNELLAVLSTSGFGRLNPATGDVVSVATASLHGVERLNDAAIDFSGRCWAGSASSDTPSGGNLFRFVGQQVSHHLGGIGMSNGLDWAPDGRTLYHADSTAGTVTALSYKLERGELGEGNVLRTIPPEVGLPDGLTADSDGAIWLALWGCGQVWCLHPTSGSVLAVVEVPTRNVTSCTFGGDALDTLFITTAQSDHDAGGGLLYACHVRARGLAPRRYGGLLS